MSRIEPIGGGGDIRPGAAAGQARADVARERLRAEQEAARPERADAVRASRESAEAAARSLVLPAREGPLPVSVQIDPKRHVLTTEIFDPDTDKVIQRIPAGFGKPDPEEAARSGEAGEGNATGGEDARA